MSNVGLVGLSFGYREAREVAKVWSGEGRGDDEVG